MDAVAICTAATGVVVAAKMVEVAVKEPKQISMGLARIAAMLVRKMTPDRTTMLHSEFPITPTRRANYQGVKLGLIRKGATQSILD
jgi:hypothetical protein